MHVQPSRLSRFALLGSLAFAVAACGGSQEGGTSAGAGASGSSPEAAVLQSARLLRDNDINGLAAASVPSTHLEQAQARWAEHIRKQDITDEDRAQFAETMAKLTADDAEEQLMAEIRPQLAQFQGEMQAQLPAMVAMGKGFVIATINENQDIPAENKPQLVDLVNALGSWMEKGHFAEVDRAERAVGEITKTARSLPVRTLDEVHAMDLDGVLDMAGVMTAGAKSALRHYDIDIDGALDSVRAETLEQDGDTAKVRVHVNLFDTPLSFDTDMVRVDGNWYDKQSIDSLNEAIEEG